MDHSTAFACDLLRRLPLMMLLTATTSILSTLIHKLLLVPDEKERVCIALSRGILLVLSGVRFDHSSPRGSFLNLTSWDVLILHTNIRIAVFL